MTPEQRTHAIVHNAADRALSSHGFWVPLRVRTAIAETVLDAVTGWGMTITDVCGCGQPVGVCPCGDPRCWRCDPWVEPLPVPCGQCMVCAGRIVGGDGECYAASQECAHKPAPQPSGTIQGTPGSGGGISGRKNLSDPAASLSESQPWEGNAVVLIDGQEIPVRADLTIQPAAWSVDAHLNPADELYLPLGSCVVRLPDGREGAAIVTSVQNGVCGSLSGFGPPPTSKPLPTPIAEEKPNG